MDLSDFAFTQVVVGPDDLLVLQADRDLAPDELTDIVGALPANLRGRVVIIGRLWKVSVAPGLFRETVRDIVREEIRNAQMES